MKEITPPRNMIRTAILFTVIGFVIYAPVLGNGFLSDDYDSLYRICIQKRIIYKEFLRPMIDISFYLNYLLSGLSPGSYYIFNISVHIINSLLVFRIAFGFVMFDKKDQHLFAFLSGLIFLIYPFHNESIVWLSGRLSSMACLFALLSIIIIRERAGKTANIIAATFYLLGLLCYESIIFLPLIILMITWMKKSSLKKLSVTGLFWLTIMCLYLVVRFLLSGEITGDYGNRIADLGLKRKMLNAGKVFGRLFLPGSENQALLIIGVVVLFFVSLVIYRAIIRKKNSEESSRSKYLSLFIFLVCSLIIPVAFGVSTRTSEGDRLLYFPSVFLCMLMVSTIVWLSKESLTRTITLSIITAYFLVFLEINNLQWVKASSAAHTVLDAIRHRGSRDIILINVPDELEGAFIFRNGLVKALIIYKMDTSGIKIVNYLKRTDYLRTGKITPIRILDSTFLIYPSVRVENQTNQTIQLVNTKNNSYLTVRKDRNLIYYWNKESLVRLF
jgi:protein O-mannosyl-transferase